MSWTEVDLTDDDCALLRDALTFASSRDAFTASEKKRLLEFARKLHKGA